MLNAKCFRIKNFVVELPTKTANFDVLELPLDINIFAPFFFCGVFSINGTTLGGQAAEKRKKKKSYT